MSGLTARVRSGCGSVSYDLRPHYGLLLLLREGDRAVTTSFRCGCGHDTEVYYEVDGYRVLELWTEDGELKCEVCGADLDRDAVYTKLSIDHAGDMTEAAMDYAEDR